MLAMYSSVLKKEKFMQRLSEDAVESSSVANDLTCDLKSLAVNSSEGRLDVCLEQVKSAEDNLKILNALVNNLRQNLEGYVSTLVPTEQKENKQEQEEEKQEARQPAVMGPAPDEKQLSDIMNMIKTLKELKESIPNER
jgi:hypothetical protein